MEELQKELNVNTETVQEVETQSEAKTNLADFPRLEDLLKSEKEVNVKTEIEGLEQVQNAVQTENKEFSKKKDGKKILYKRRFKVVTGVYIAVASLLLLLTGVNVATLAVLNNAYTKNANTINSTQQVVDKISTEEVLNPTGEDIKISLNEPRDYADDNKELTFLDKVTILFRNLFG